MKEFELEVWFNPYAFLLVKIYAYDKDSALAVGRSLYPHADAVCLFDKEFYDARD